MNTSVSRSAPYARSLYLFAALCLLSVGLAGCGGGDTGPEQQECRDCDDLTSSRDLPMCAVGADCEPEEEPEPPPAPTLPVTHSIAEFNSYGGFERSSDPTVLSVPGWAPAGGCAWGAGIDAIPEAKDTGATGLRINRGGCRAESFHVAIPDNVWRSIGLTFSGNVWGWTCPAEGCVRVTMAWYDASGSRVLAGTPPVYLQAAGGNWTGYTVLASKPYGGVSLRVFFESLMPDAQGFFVDAAHLTAE